MTYEIRIIQKDDCGKDSEICQIYKDDYIDTDPMELINLVYSTLIQATYDPEIVIDLMEQFVKEHRNETS